MADEAAPLTRRALCRLAPSMLGPVGRSYVRCRIRPLISSSVSQAASGKVLSRSSKSPKSRSAGGRSSRAGAAMPPRPGKSHCRGWKDILWRTYERIGEDRLLAVAAGVVFYGLLALFPAITAMVSLYGLFAESLDHQRTSFSGRGSFTRRWMSIVRDQVDRLAAKGDAKLGFGFIIGLGIALWSANSGMKAILDALNVVYEEKEKRGFIKLTLDLLRASPWRRSPRSCWRSALSSSCRSRSITLDCMQ